MGWPAAILCLTLTVTTVCCESSQVVINDPDATPGDSFGKAVAQTENGSFFAVASSRAMGSVYLCSQTAAVDVSDGGPCGQVLHAGPFLPIPYQLTFGASLSLSADGAFLAVGSTTAYAPSEPAILSTFRCAKTNCTPWQTFTLPGALGNIVALSGDGSRLATALVGAAAPLRNLQSIYPIGPVPSSASRVSGLAICIYVCSTAECIVSDYISSQEGVASLALSYDGSLLAAGALFANLSGQVATYSCDGGLCSPQQTLLSPGGPDAYQDRFGSAVAWSASGDVLVVSAVSRLGGVGAVMMYSCAQGVCAAPQVILPALRGVGSFGTALSLSAGGDLLAVGASAISGGPGAVFLFACNGSSCGELQVIAPDPNWDGSEFGQSVVLSGDGGTLLAGAPGVAGGMGVVYRFEQLAQSASGSPAPNPSASASTSSSPSSSATPSLSLLPAPVSSGGAGGQDQHLSVGGLAGIFVASVVFVAAAASAGTWAVLTGRCWRCRAAGSIDALRQGGTSTAVDRSNTGSIQDASTPQYGRVSAAHSSSDGANRGSAARLAYYSASAGGANRGDGRPVDASSGTARGLIERLLDPVQL